MAEKDKTICKMSEVLASQVAAGEVVERPASVVKELVENSIDAKAKLIRVEIRRGGVSMIKVADNGVGMSREDAGLCLERHATSKLLSFEDLFEIRQLGFRGEALPSIASVSELGIKTRRAQDVEGVQVVCSGGKTSSLENSGCAPGTEITVSNLFFNTPVRRKFLKSEDTEAGHIEHQLKLHALAFPDIRFIFVRDGQVVFDVPATSDLRQRIAAFTGREVAGQLLGLRPQTGPGLRVSGFVMPLSAARRNRRMQFVFLNGRPIEDKIVLRAVRDGFGGFPTGLHPSMFLYLEVDPGLVDVNVHPAKREVRFRRPSDVTLAIIESVSETLAAHARGEGEAALGEEQASGVPANASADASTVGVSGGAMAGGGTSFVLKPILEPQQRELQLSSRQPFASATDLFKGAAPSEKPEPKQQAAKAPAVAPHMAPLPVAPAAPAATSATAAVPSPPAASAEPLCAEPAPPGFRPLGSFAAGQYLLFENKDGLVMLSPRAARERIVFERLLEANKRPIPSQRLLQPVLIELDAREAGAAREALSRLEQAGFLLSPFGRRTLRVEAVPAILSLPKVEEFMLDLIRSFSSGETRMKRPRTPFEPYAIQIARSYVMREDMRPWMQAPMALLKELLRCEIPYCTPAGRPTMVPVTLNEVKRKFQAQ